MVHVNSVLRLIQGIPSRQVLTFLHPTCLLKLLLNILNLLHITEDNILYVLLQVFRVLIIKIYHILEISCFSKQFTKQFMHISLTFRLDIIHRFFMTRKEFANFCDF